MADGELTLKLDDATVRRLQAAADAVGQPIDSYAADVLAGAVSGEDWAEDYRRAAEYDRTGKYVSLEEALTEFRDAVDERLSKKT